VVHFSIADLGAVLGCAHQVGQIDASMGQRNRVSPTTQLPEKGIAAQRKLPIVLLQRLIGCK